MDYPINEIFTTIQCEGTHAGVPSVFIRLQGCDVGCSWCDTKHTWALDKDSEVSAAEVLADKTKDVEYALIGTDDIVQKVQLASPVGHVVITGGEPAWYDLRPLTEALIKKNYFVQIETSGLYDIRVDPKTWVTVSPKSTKAGTTKLKALTRADEIKFPVGGVKDIARVKQLDETFALPRNIIWLQPLSKSNSATKICIDAAIRYGWRLSIQTHKYLDIR